MKRRSFSVSGVGKNARLDGVLADELKVAATEAKALIDRGAVYVDGKRAKEADRLLGGARVVMVVLEESGRGVLEEKARPAQLAIVFEDPHLLVVAKPPGVVAQPTAGRVGESLLDLASAHLGKPAGLVHRLDRDTSGVTVFGKTRASTSGLAAQFREGSAQKRYLAATGPGLPAEGVIDLPLSRDPSRPGRYRATKKANGVPAVTQFHRMYGDEAFCLVALRPKTGRTHQLRAHLAAVGAPILGDTIYGGAAEAAGLKADRCLLHAQSLEL
jgi:23S rRNA pseudouridine1911/1915/1917 synthase